MGVQDRDWYRKEMRARSRPPDRPKPARSSAVLVASIIGAVVACFGINGAFQWYARSTSVALIAKQAARQEQLDRDEQARQVASRAQSDRIELLRDREIGEQRKVQEAMRRATLAAAERKERAWKKFYKRPEICTESATVECANGFIRAKRAFEEKYARGEL